MKSANKIAALVLLVLVGATVYGLVRTGREPLIPPGGGAGTAATAGEAPLVDQTPLLTAQAFAHMPTSPAEMPYAQQALQVGDQEMDLAFALAILDATQHPPVLSKEAREIQATLQNAENALASQQAQVAQLTVAEAKASGAQKDALDDQLDLAKAQQELRQDAVDDAKQDLMRAGGDPQGRMQAMVQEHEAASQASDTTKLSANTPVEPHGLVQRLQQWSALHRKQLQLWQARQDASSEGSALKSKHDSLQTQLGATEEQAASGVASGSESGAPSSGPSVTPTSEAATSASHAESAAKLARTKERDSERKTLATLDHRIDNEKQLTGIYEQWIGVVAAEQRALVNGGLRGLLLILAIATIALFVDGWIGSLLGKMAMDRRRTEALRTTGHVTLQIVGVLLIFLVIFGLPTQLGTFLGLAGAGLTVALKDFIISFIGWFVLMGKSGIRLGDWVEINGVTGEVAELGMFHTVLLETGNWTDSGHPTGRRVTFTNSFAVEGHYFNFSTSGQWLWDELQIVLPSGQNPYPFVDAIQKRVQETTAEGARQAEMEWRSAAKSRNMNAISAAPVIDVKPVIGGTQISVRYITRANERSQLRAKLNHAAVDLLGAGIAPHLDSESLKPAVKSN